MFGFGNDLLRVEIQYSRLCHDYEWRALISEKDYYAMLSSKMSYETQLECKKAFKEFAEKNGIKNYNFSKE